MNNNFSMLGSVFACLLVLSVTSVFAVNNTSIDLPTISSNDYLNSGIMNIVFIAALLGLGFALGMALKHGLKLFAALVVIVGVLYLFGIFAPSLLTGMFGFATTLKDFVIQFTGSGGIAYAYQLIILVAGFVVGLWKG